MGGIWVFAEKQEDTLELLNKGQEIARDLHEKLVAFATSRTMAENYIAYGADQIYLLPPLTEKEAWGDYLYAIADEAVKLLPAVILIAGTMRGREMAARLAQKLNTGLCSGCINLSVNQSGQLEMQRLIYGGAAVQTVVCTGTPQMAAIPPRTFEPAPYQEGHPGQIGELFLTPQSSVKIQELKPVVSAEGNLAEARVVICAGRGIEKEEDMEMIRRLAQATDGQIGCTRPISEELHWLPEDLCIGLSGQQVKPDLYVGVGVSGQIQHTTGIRESKVVLAINRDENAPVFEVADFGVIGDLYEVIPKLTDELEKRK